MARENVPHGLQQSLRGPLFECISRVIILTGKRTFTQAGGREAGNSGNYPSKNLVKGVSSTKAG